MKKINFITILILLILLGIIAIVLFFLVKNNPNVENNSEYGEIALLDDSSLFFTVSLNINKICDYVNNDQSEELYSILDENYLKNNSLTTSNVIEKFYEKYNGTSFSAIEIYVVSNDKNYKFFVKGNLKVEIMDEPADIIAEDYFILNYDIEESIFSISPITKDLYLNYIKSKDFEFNNLTKNEYNKVDYVNITDENLAAMYFNDFISILFNDTESAYKKLSDSTKEMYFNTYEDFLKYLEDNLEYLENLKYVKYSVKNSIIHYIDNYDNKYSFIINKIMDYQVVFYKSEDVKDNQEE